MVTVESKMVARSRSKPGKKGLLCYVGFIILCTGLVPSLVLTYYPAKPFFYTINNLTLVSGDGTTIDALCYIPRFEITARVGVVVAHGFCGNKQVMQPLSLELVKRGMHVVSIDFRGHGSSSGHLLSSGDTSSLGMDVMAAMEYLVSEFNVSRLGLVGHSMGGRTVMAVASQHPSLVNATVSIGMVSQAYTSSQIPNLMVAIGEQEQLFTRENALDFLSAYTMLESPEIGVLYGNFSLGNASKVVVGPFADHLLEVVDPVIIDETVSWFKGAFSFEGVRVTSTSTLLVLFTGVAIAGCAFLVFLALHAAGNRSWRGMVPGAIPAAGMKSGSVAGPVAAYILVAGTALASVLVLPRIFSDVLPITMFNYVFSLSFAGVLVGIVAVMALHVLRHRSGLEGVKSWLGQVRASVSGGTKPAAFGIAAGLLVVCSLAAILHWSLVASIPTPRELGTIIGIALLCAPFAIVKEFYFRKLVQDRVHARITGGSTLSRTQQEYWTAAGLSVLMDTVLFVPVMLFTWKSPTMGFTALSLTVFIAFNAIQQLLVTWVYIAGHRHVLASSVFYAIIFAWMVVIFYPFGLPRAIL